jgi:hypothetical protein
VNEVPVIVVEAEGHFAARAHGASTSPRWITLRQFMSRFATPSGATSPSGRPTLTRDLSARSTPTSRLTLHREPSSVTSGAKLAVKLTPDAEGELKADAFCYRYATSRSGRRRSTPTAAPAFACGSDITRPTGT